MKRLNPTAACQPSSRHRRGAVFHYYMMYLLLSSVLLTTAGMSIHAVLKADRVDSTMARDLQTLLRLDGQLRNDTREVSDCECTAETLTIPAVNGTSDGASKTRWTIAENVVKRETIDDDTVQSSDRFVLTRGTQIQFARTEQQVTLTIADPPMVGGDGKNNPSGPSAEVQISLWLNSPSDAPGDDT